MKITEDCYGFGMGRKAVNIARLPSELEGSYALMKYMGFQVDMDTIEEMKKRYYSFYFKTTREERGQGG